MEYMKAEIVEFEIKSKMKNMRDMYSGISDFRMVTSLEYSKG
jgi:hypothetical protein